MIPARIYDLSQPVFNNCPQYPDVNPRPAQVRLFYILGVNGVNKEIVQISTHTGTHVDAPFHFFEGGKTIDEIALENFVGWARVLDVRGRPPGHEIGVADLQGCDIGDGEIALLDTGWGDKRAITREFLTQYPYLGGDGAQWLVDRGVRGVGIDAVSLGGYNDPAKAGPAHRAMLGNGKFVAEELHYPPETRDGKRRLFVAAPVKLQGCSGAWARAMLWEF